MESNVVSFPFDEVLRGSAELDRMKEYIGKVLEVAKSFFKREGEAGLSFANISGRPDSVRFPSGRFAVGVSFSGNVELFADMQKGHARLVSHPSALPSEEVAEVYDYLAEAIGELIRRWNLEPQFFRFTEHLRTAAMRAPGAPTSVDIVVTELGPGKFRAELFEIQDVCGVGKSSAEAVGNLVMTHANKLGLRLVAEMA